MIPIKINCLSYIHDLNGVSWSFCTGILWWCILSPPRLPACVNFFQPFRVYYRPMQTCPGEIPYHTYHYYY